MTDFHEIGVSDAVVTVSSRTEPLVQAIQADTDFELVDKRSHAVESGNWDVLVVECHCPSVPSRNAIGIRNRERLAILLPADDDSAPEVRALRTDFPITIHQNDVAPGDSKSLCLFREIWPVVRRSWTAPRMLRRIQWWLTETSLDQLHPDDQELEELFFDAGMELVLPNEESSSSDQRLILSGCGAPHLPNKPVIRALYGDSTSDSDLEFVAVWIRAGPVVHGPIEHRPRVLKDLADRLAERGVDIGQVVTSALHSQTSDGDSYRPDAKVLLLLELEMVREPGGLIERRDVKAFLTDVDLVTFGQSFGALFGETQGLGKQARHTLRHTRLVGGAPVSDWHDLALLPIEVTRNVSPAFPAIAAGHTTNEGNFKAVIGGVGALGGRLVEIWHQEQWGNWTLVDPDYVRPHNLVRHIAKDFHIGWNKSDAVDWMLQATYDLPGRTDAICASVSDNSNERVADALKQADLVLDATTKLDVPRDLAQMDGIGRSASIFITPGGTSSVLLLENRSRSIRLDALEAQYYRAILNEPWGKHHLQQPDGSFTVGASCRDVSFVLSNDLLQTHSGVLAGQTRRLIQLEDAHIGVWVLDPIDGSVSVKTMPTREVHSYECGEWTVVYDVGLVDKARTLRSEILPAETGGLLVGYVDTYLLNIYLVDVLGPPGDSDHSQGWFERGVEGVSDGLREIGRMTGGVVEYIGEWHSHPAGVESMPSAADITQVRYTAELQANEGLPALMLIVGENTWSITQLHRVDGT